MIKGCKQFFAFISYSKTVPIYLNGIRKDDDRMI